MALISVRRSSLPPDVRHHPRYVTAQQCNQPCLQSHIPQLQRSNQLTPKPTTGITRCDTTPPTTTAVHGLRSPLIDRGYALLEGCRDELASNTEYIIEFLLFFTYKTTISETSVHIVIT